VTSLYVWRTSKMRLRPSPRPESQRRFASRSSHSSYSLPNLPLSQRSSMSRNSSMPSLYGFTCMPCMAIAPAWRSAKSMISLGSSRCSVIMRECQ